MIDFTVYDGQSGRILRVGQSQPTTLGHQPLGDNEAMIFGAYDADTHFIAQGRARMRPPLPDVTVSGQGWTFAGPLPEGTIAHIESRFLSGEVALTAPAASLAVPDAARVRIVAPWPCMEALFDLDGTPAITPDGAQIIAPDLDRMKAALGAALYEQADVLTLSMLGNPDENTRRRWLLKRTIFDRSLAGTLTDADRTALAEGVRYTSDTIEGELSAIGAKVGFENWVTLRADGVRAEAGNRLGAATTAQDVLAAIAWAKTESATAVAEAQTMLDAA